MSKVRILVSYHKPSTLLKSEVFVPIHVGRTLGKSHNKYCCANSTPGYWLFNNLIGDDTGDNISHKNREYCELTAVYWAWKNLDKLGDPDYVGFMHYRRHLCFDINNTEKTNRYGLLSSPRIDQAYIDKYKLDDVSVQKLVSQYDIVTVEKTDIEGCGSRNLYEHYKESSPYLFVKDYELALSILKEKYPEYLPTIQEYNQSRYGYFTNIFVMKRDIFNSYAKWLFAILEEVERKTDISLYNQQASRIYGYLSEWLFGIWYEYQKKTQPIKVLELKRTLVEKTDEIVSSSITQVYGCDSVDICFATDSNYVSKLAVAINSVIVNSSKAHKYDINILASGISEYQRALLVNLSKQENVSIRVIDVDAYINSSEHKSLSFYESAHLNKSTYFRLFAPKIFSNYKKILYLDSDLVVEKDVAEIFNVELGTNLLAAIKDIELIRCYCTDAKIKDYIDNTLQMRNVEDYVNAGVCLMNLELLRNENVEKDFFQILKKEIKGFPRFHDQDVLNKVCQGRILYLDLRWNVEYHIPIYSPDWKDEIPLKYLELYKNARLNPWIVHFAGGIKPWHSLNVEMGEYFWKYARQTPYYEYLLLNSVKIPGIDDDPRFSRQTLIRRYWKYRILKNLSFGSRNKYYKKCFKMYERLIAREK